MTIVFMVRDDTEMEDYVDHVTADQKVKCSKPC